MNNITKEAATYEKMIGGQGSILPNPDTILAKQGTNRFHAYRKLLNDPHVWSCVQSRKSGVLSGTIPSINIPTNIAALWEKIDLVEIMDSLLDAILYGYQPIELIWQETAEGYLPTPIAKPQEWFVFHTAGPPVFAQGDLRDKHVPNYKFIFPVYKGSYMNPYGIALLSKCYWPVTFKNGGIRFWVTFTERYGMPMMLGKYERGSTTDEATELASHLVDMAQDTVIIAPSDINLQLVEPNRHGSVELYTKLIENSNTEISKAILSQTLTTDIDAGSRAAAEIHFKVREEVIESDRRFISKWLQKLADMIEEVNKIYR